MAVFRIEKTHDYTIMSNHLRNTGLVAEIQRDAFHDTAFAEGLDA